MIWETKIFLFLLNVLAISIPLAIFEVVLEKERGWGQALPKNKWYGKKVGIRNLVMRFICWVVGVPYFSGYGLLLWYILFPLLIALEYVFLVSNFFLLLAVFVFVLAVEDFLWFVFNPYFPALQELLKGPKGKIWWHKRWLRIYGGYHLPFSYAISASLAIIFLFLS